MDILLISYHAYLHLKEKTGVEMAIIDLIDYIQNMKIADTHEHLVPEKFRNNIPLDFTYLLGCYIDTNLISAGMNMDEMQAMRTPGRKMIDKLFDSWESGNKVYPFIERLPEKEFGLDKKWDLFEPFWNKIRNTGYAKCIKLAVTNLFGIKDITRDTYVFLSEELEKTRRPGWYDHVLKDKANIEFCIVDFGTTDLDCDYFFPSIRFDRFVYIKDRLFLNRLEFETKLSIHDLDDLVHALRVEMDLSFKKGMKAIKSGLAYQRSLFYEYTPREEAERIFNRLFSHPDATLSLTESKPLQDYMMHQVIKASIDLKIPIQFHTGLLNGNGNFISNSNPTHLTNLFLKYPEARFDIFHGGYPYHSELAVLVHNFPNVYANLCWMPIISPWMSERILHEWLEIIPISKIFAFGGDYLIVEGSYGHSLMAREVVKNVLIHKVETNYFSEKEAFDFAERILYKNAREFFQI